MNLKSNLRLIIIILLISSICFVSIVSAGETGGSMPVDTIQLTNIGNDYNLGYITLKFEFNKNLYAIHIRSIKNDYIRFFVMKFDNDDLENITAYTITEDFNLSIGESKEIDLNQDKNKDLFLKLNDITKTGTYGSIRHANFTIKSIKSLGSIEQLKTLETGISKNITKAFNEEKIIVEPIKEKENITNEEIINPNLEENLNKNNELDINHSNLSEQTIIESPKSTILEIMINWFKGLFD